MYLEADAGEMGAAGNAQVDNSQLAFILKSYFFD